MGRIELFDIQTESKQMTCEIKLLEKEQFDHLTACKKRTDI